MIKLLRAVITFIGDDSDIDENLYQIDFFSDQKSESKSIKKIMEFHWRSAMKYLKEITDKPQNFISEEKLKRIETLMVFPN